MAPRIRACTREKNNDSARLRPRVASKAMELIGNAVATVPSMMAMAKIVASAMALAMATIMVTAKRSEGCRKGRTRNARRLRSPRERSEGIAAHEDAHEAQCHVQGCSITC
jgi:hypothetical protein